jgi:hypothetical protein
MQFESTDSKLLCDMTSWRTPFSECYCLATWTIGTCPEVEQTVPHTQLACHFRHHYSCIQQPVVQNNSHFISQSLPSIRWDSSVRASCLLGFSHGNGSHRFWLGSYIGLACFLKTCSSALARYSAYLSLARSSSSETVDMLHDVDGPFFAIAMNISEI